MQQDWGGVGRAACRQLELCSQRAERRVRRHKSSMLMMYVMLMLMLLVVVVTMTMMTMMTMVMMVMRDSYQAVFLSMTETARRRTERMQEETRSTGSLVMTRVVCVCVGCGG